MKRPRVLLIAEAANPEWVSVPLVGWNIALALREVADVHIITQIRNRDAFLRRGLIEGQDFTAIDSEAIAAPFYRLAELLRGGSGKGWTTITAIQSLTYPYFEHLVWQKFGDAIRNREFDLVHRVTPLSPTSPSSLAAKCKRANVPFVLGPLNGGLPWPKGYNEERAKEKEWLSFVRSLYSLNPMIKSTYSNASAVIVGSRHTQKEVSKYRVPTFYIPENGVDSNDFKMQERVPQHDSKLRGIFVGRLVPYKGADVAIKGCANALREGRMELEIVGDGPEMSSLVNMVAELGLNGAVAFRGWLSHGEVASRLAASDLLVFPSIREFGGGVVLEAMASGVVPIVVDYGGPGELVSDNTGFKIPLGSKEILTRSIARIVDGVLNSSLDLFERSISSHERVQEIYTWRKKANQIEQVYRSVF
jgi:glycosyltransferase involved in cell wall biosynthesis